VRDAAQALQHLRVYLRRAGGGGGERRRRRVCGGGGEERRSREGEFTQPGILEEGGSERVYSRICRGKSTFSR